MLEKGLELFHHECITTSCAHGDFFYYYFPLPLRPPLPSTRSHTVITWRLCNKAEFLLNHWLNFICFILEGGDFGYWSPLTRLLRGKDKDGKFCGLKGSILCISNIWHRISVILQFFCSFFQAGEAGEESSDSDGEQEETSHKLIRKVSTSGQIRAKVGRDVRVCGASALFYPLNRVPRASGISLNFDRKSLETGLNIWEVSGDIREFYYFTLLYYRCWFSAVFGHFSNVVPLLRAFFFKLYTY